MKCLVIDPDKKSRTDLAEKLEGLKQFLVLDSFKSFSEAEPEFLRGEAEVIFFDANCIDGDGSLITQMSKSRPRLVITGENKEAAIEAFNLDAVDFLLKPVTAVRLAKTAARLVEQKRQSNGNGTMNVLFVRDGHNYTKVSLKDITLIMAKETILHIYTATDEFTLKGLLKRLGDQLPEKDFYRINKSYIIRLDKIASIDGDAVRIGRFKITVNDKHKEELLAKLKLL
jgi:two-component system LytT family response regulator